MGILHKSAASIGFYGDDLDPAEITAALGANPTVGVSKGGQWKTKSGAVKTAVIGSWRIEAEYCEPGDLDSQINGLLDGLSDDLVAWRSLSRRYRGCAFCGLFLASGNEGLMLRSKTLLRLGSAACSLTSTSTARTNLTKWELLGEIRRLNLSTRPSRLMVHIANATAGRSVFSRDAAGHRMYRRLCGRQGLGPNCARQAIGGQRSGHANFNGTPANAAFVLPARHRRAGGGQCGYGAGTRSSSHQAQKSDRDTRSVIFLRNSSCPDRWPGMREGEREADKRPNMKRW
jgi:hypothetical protein